MLKIRILLAALAFTSNVLLVNADWEDFEMDSAIYDAESVCVDLKLLNGSEWQDIDGDGCNFYAEFISYDPEYEYDGDYTTFCDWGKYYVDESNGNLTANQACCICGGGEIIGIPDCVCANTVTDASGGDLFCAYDIPNVVEKTCAYALTSSNDFCPSDQAIVCSIVTLHHGHVYLEGKFNNITDVNVWIQDCTDMLHDNGFSADTRCSDVTSTNEVDDCNHCLKISIEAHSEITVEEVEDFFLEEEQISINAIQYSVVEEEDEGSAMVSITVCLALMIIVFSFIGCFFLCAKYPNTPERIAAREKLREEEDQQMRVEKQSSDFYSSLRNINESGARDSTHV